MIPFFGHLTLGQGMKPPIKNKELEPAGNIDRLLKSFHEPCAPLDQVVKSLKNIVVWTHLWIVIVREEQIEITFEHANDLFELLALGIFDRVLLDFC